PAYRVQRALQVEAGQLPDRDLDLVIQTLPDANFSQLKEQLGQLGGHVSGEACNHFAGYLYLSLPAYQLDALAALDGVLWVEPDIEMHLSNDVATGDILHTDLISDTLGLTGDGQVIGVADTGLDSGDYGTLHPDIQGRVLNAYCRGRPDPCDWSDYVTHGTHVVGSILGDGTVSKGQYAGVAPGSSLVMQSMSTATGQFIVPTDIGELYQQAYSVGARIHSNSYGSAANGAYTTSSQQTDTALWELQDMLTLFAAGNSAWDSDKDGFIDPDSIDAPGTAKNVLTVGASENYRPSILSIWGPSYGDPISADRVADNASGMAAFSGRGPTDDGRVKPEIVAPGTFIASLRSRQYIFDDDLEGDSSSYIPGFICADCNDGTGNDAWSLSTEDAHSGSHAWVETISGEFDTDAMTFLLTPAMDIRKAGVSGNTVYFDMSFWHKSNLSAGDESVVSIFDGSDLSKIATDVPVDESPDGTTYTYV
ncbi:MAG: S8 family serine peptidase, partial [Anaerolineales bacterium]|nr:S8 family serine peptidase [Anaerolineales bacterium]